MQELLNQLCTLVNESGGYSEPLSRKGYGRSPSF